MRERRSSRFRQFCFDLACLLGSYLKNPRYNTPIRPVYGLPRASISMFAIAFASLALPAEPVHDAKLFDANVLAPKDDVRDCRASAAAVRRPERAASALCRCASRAGEGRAGHVRGLVQPVHDGARVLFGLPSAVAATSIVRVLVQRVYASAHASDPVMCAPSRAGADASHCHVCVCVCVRGAADTTTNPACAACAVLASPPPVAARPVAATPVAFCYDEYGQRAIAPRTRV